jgi:dipeptidyl aminopeptidase/acylaminoacyl peptidase
MPSHSMRVRAAWFLVLGALALPLSSALLAAQAVASNGWDPQAILKVERYVRPPATIERIVLASRTDISFDAPNADRSWFLRTTGKERGTVAAYGRPHKYIGGLNVDERANRARELTVSRATGLVLVNPQTGEERTLQTPAGASISAPSWSPDGRQVAFIANFEAASYAYVADVATGRSTQVSRTPLLATLHTSLDWTADGRSLVAVLVPDSRGPIPTHGEGGIEDGPQIRFSTAGRPTPQRVHWSLLEDAHDKEILKYHTTGQLALLDVARRTARKVGAPTMVRDVDASHDGQYLRVTRMTEPFSYIVPVSSFGSVQELWDASGKAVATLATTPLREEGGGGFGGGGAGAGGAAADTGKRNIQWNPVGPGLVYLQSVFAAAPERDGNGRAARGGAPGGTPGGAQAGGAPAGGARAPARPQATSVRYLQWLPPFGPNDTKLLFEGGAQLTNVQWSADGSTMFVNDSGMVSAVRVSEPTRKYALGRGVTLPGGGGGFGGGGGGGFGQGAGAADTIGTGGALAMKRGPNGGQVVVLASDKKSVFVSGSRSYGAEWHRRAPRPWRERLDFESGQRTRIFDSPAGTYDQVVAALDDDHSQVLFTRQSATMIEDAWLRDTRAGTERKLTNAVDVAPEVTQAQRKRIQVTRPRDNATIWVDVVLPREWRRGDGTPGVIWFYPREYATEQAYQRSKYSVNINQYPAVPAARPATATELWVAGGYVFIEPDVPIFGDSGRMNDNYTRDLKENLDAVLDAVVDSGFVQRDRVGLGGHSYGAFSTVNAMTLVPYFKAGIAGDGMYNRTLTPFGFQSERRTFFDAQETYMDMSPFLRADKIAGALLLYHNLEDQNVGTAPMSSIRMMQALQGLGKEAALYLYPYEDHSVATYESDLDQWARWVAWFDVHVKGVGKEKPTFTP